MMKQVKKRLLALVLAIVMAVGVVPASVQTAQAATGDDAGRRIKLGKIVWSKDMSTYHFSGVTANFTDGETQKLFCLSVSNGGSFVIPKDFLFTGRRTVRAVQKIGNSFEYISLVRDGKEGEPIAGKELTSIMVTGEDITNEQVEGFIEGLTFKRNGVAADAVQEVSVVANQVDLNDSEMMAMASGGEVHYYDYVVFDGEQKTWYDAYNEAKASKFSGLQGYLATITDQTEELYLYGSFKDMVPGDDIRAWIGGARTVIDHIKFDAATIADGALKPVKADGSIATDWYWMCGPEAGKAFYRTNEYGTAQGAYSLNDMYNDWNGGEPNNRYDGSLGKDKYEQEYALEYGYSAANWNDYSPYNIYRGEWGMYGYIIEYSPYTLDSDITGKQNDPIEEDVPSATGFREVRADKATDLDITVKDFIISTDDARQLDEAGAKEKADVTVTDGDDTITATDSDNLIAVDGDQFNKVKKGEKGEYKLTYTYTNESDSNRTVSEKATVTVVDEAASGTANDGSDKKVEIGANHFSITIEQARDIEKNPNGSAQEQLIKELANAVALYDGEEVDPKDINITGNTIKAKKTDKDSPYTVTFEYKGVEVTVNVSVLDNGSEKTTVNLTANDFTVTAGQGNQLDTSEFIKKSAATATASDGSAVTVTPDPSDLQALNSAIQNGPLGEYKVKVTAKTKTGASASTVVTVKVVEYPYIDANNFIISVEDTDKASADTIKKESDAGILTEDGKDKTSSITVPQDDVDKLKGVDEPGTVSGITLQAPNSPAGERDVTATVVDATQKGWADNDEQTGAYVVIGANNFNLTIKQAQQIEADYTSAAAQDIIKTLANAVATNNGKAVDRVHITGNPGNIKAENGVYDVTFSYWGQTVTVKATVKDEGSADASNIPAGQVPDINLTANDFSIPAKSPVLETTPEDTFKKLADVVAKHNDGSSVTDITPDAKQLEELAKAVQDGKKGEYPVKVTATDDDGKTVTTTVTVTVTDEGGDSTGADITNPNPDDEHIGANNFVIGTDDFPLLTPENVIKLSNAEAYDIDTKADVPVTKVDISKVENKPGKYPITLSTDKGTSTTITVTIDENWKTIGDVDKASDANKDKTSVDQDKAVPAGEPTDTVGDDRIYEISNPKDVPQDVDAGREVDKVNIDGVDLPPEAWTSDGTTLTIGNSAMQGKEEGTHPVVVTYKDGTKRTFNIIVVTSADKPGDTVGVDKVYEISNPKDVTQDVDAGREVEKVNIDGVDLPPEAWTSDGTTLTISNSAMQGKKEGTYPVVVTYKDGSKRTFNIKVVAYDETTVVKKVPTFNMQKDIGVGKKFKLNLVGRDANAVPQFKTSNKKIATVDNKGVIKAKKKGKCTITASVIQNGSYYTVKIKLIVKKSMKMYNLKNAALVKQQGVLPEFNVYKRVVKGKKTKLKFTNVTKDAKVTYTTSDKKVATISKKGVIKGKKKGFAKITAKIEQNGYTYYTRLFVRVDDGTTNKQLKKYLK